jgi:hypothetical protein
VFVDGALFVVPGESAVVAHDAEVLGKGEAGIFEGVPVAACAIDVSDAVIADGKISPGVAFEVIHRLSFW